MRFPDHILDDIRSRLAVSHVVGRKVALKKAGREWRGLSPFKVEKTPSFFVNDQKGFYHCFASGEHGDIFKFVMTTEGLTFIEAVERLAAEAGVVLPKSEPRDQKSADERQRLLDLLEASATFFEAQLRSSSGTEARRYVTERRQLKRETLASFRIGFAPNSRTALMQHLGTRGYTVPEMARAGMVIAGEDIREPYDRFRHRVMFPIQDIKGRVIAFGGRALEAGVPAKYLNSPETPLFHKGSILFNAQRARSAAFERGRVLVVEGYMDVVALAEAGIAEAVAPLGTALTEPQLELLWRFCPEPTLCFDGDGAGRKAAFRALDVALPHLKPGMSLSFAFLPDGLDPDDLVRQRGVAELDEVIAKQRPLIDVLFEREVASGTWTTPERRARLEHQVSAHVKRITDPVVRQHYAMAMRERLRDLWGQTSSASHAAKSGHRQSGYPRMGQPNSGHPPGTGGRQGFAAPGRGASGRGPMAGPRPGGRTSGRGTVTRFSWSNEPDARTLRSASLTSSRLVGAVRPAAREALIVGTVLHHPWLLDEHAELFAALELGSPELARLRDGVLTALADIGELDSGALTTHLARLGVASPAALIDRFLSHRSDKFAGVAAERPTVEAGWMDAIRVHRRAVELRRAVDVALAAFTESQSDEDLERIKELHRELAATEAADVDASGVAA